MRVLIALALVLTAVAAAPKRTSQRIVGGDVTSIEQYPSIVALLYLDDETMIFSQYCGGSILNNRSILTALHCVGFPTEYLRIRAGSSYSNSGGVVYETALIIGNPNIVPGGGFDSDIAIVRLSSFITYTDVIQQVVIAGPNYDIPDNTEVWAAGWGQLYSGGDLSEVLRHVQMWKINLDICKERYDGKLRVTDNMLCVGWLDVGGRDQCQGDSGSPLYHNKVQVGLSSFGLGCGDPVYPGVNTRVSRFVDWLRDNA